MARMRPPIAILILFMTNRSQNACVTAPVACKFSSLAAKARRDRAPFRPGASIVPALMTVFSNGDDDQEIQQKRRGSSD